ncbi:hypothetical protein D3C85_1857650 [compost metagenome]
MATIGLHDLHFVTVEGTAMGEQVLLAGRQAGTAAIAALFAESEATQASPALAAQVG